MTREVIICSAVLGVAGALCLCRTYASESDCLAHAAQQRQEAWQAANQCAPGGWDPTMTSAYMGRCSERFFAALDQVTAELDDCVAKNRMLVEQQQDVQGLLKNHDQIYKMIDFAVDHLDYDPVVKKVIQKNFNKLQELQHKIIYNTADVAGAIKHFQASETRSNTQNVPYGALHSNQFPAGSIDYSNARPYAPPQNTYTPSQNSYRPPQDTYTPSQNSYRPPQDINTPSQNSYRSPQNSYAPPQNSHTSPQTSYRPSQNSYRPPQTSYRPPQNSYTPPQNSYTPPQNSYRPPQNSYTPPQNSYRPPQNNQTPTPCVPGCARGVTQ